MAENMNPVNQWFEAQKNMFDLWQSSMNVANNKEEKAATNVFEESMKPAQEMMKKWFEVSNEIFNKSLTTYNPTYPQELITKMLSSASVYQNLMKIWEDLNVTMSGKDSDPGKFFTKWYGDYMKTVGGNFTSYLPEQMHFLLKDPMDLFKSFTGYSQNFFTPWIDNAQAMQSLLVKSMNGDQNAYLEFNKLWNEVFSGSYGKFLNIPQFSLNREATQKLSHYINTWIAYMNMMNEFMITLSNANKTTFEEIIKEYQDMAVNGTNPKTYKEFYDYWLKKNEKAYMVLFSTDEFAKLIGKILDAGVNLKKDFDSLLEKQLEFLPYPTRSDMEGVYQTLDDLKRDVRALKKEIAALKSNANSAK